MYMRNYNFCNDAVLGHYGQTLLSNTDNAALFQVQE